MQQLLLLVQVLVSILLIVLVLLQQGKGADIGASFGSGASQTIFGSQGSGSFMLRLTSVVAALFFMLSLALGYVASRTSKPQRLLDVQAPVTSTQQTDTIPLQQPSKSLNS